MCDATDRRKYLEDDISTYQGMLGAERKKAVQVQSEQPSMLFLCSAEKLTSNLHTLCLKLRDNGIYRLGAQGITVKPNLCQTGDIEQC